MAVARQLPADTGETLLAAARQAFTTGLQVTAGISAVVAVGIAVLATVMLRDDPRTGDAEQAEPARPPAAPVEPRRVHQPEEPVQLIRSGGGCVACPGEHGSSSGQLPRLRRPGAALSGTRMESDDRPHE